MTTPAITTDSTTESAATPFEQDLGALFGDYSTSGEPEPETSAAEPTSAEPALGTDTDQAAPTPPAGAEIVAPPSDGSTPSAALPVADEDPFKDTTPASYVVNGRSIPVEDIRVFKEGGAVIRPESLPNILSKLAERDTLSEQSRTAKQQYDTLSKISEWTGADNQTVTGPQAAIERIVAHAAVLAENELLISEVLQSPDLHAAGFLTTKQVPDGKGGYTEAVIFRPDAIARLQTQNELRQLKSAQALREHFKTVVAQSSQAQPAPVDFETEAPRLIQAIAEQSKLDASVLTPADKALLAKQLPANVKNGNASMAWQELVKDRIQLRTEQKTSSQKLVTSTVEATRTGLANMAAAARGVKPKPVATTPEKRISPVNERMQNEGDLYDLMQRSAARAIRANR